MGEYLNEIILEHAIDNDQSEYQERYFPKYTYL